MATIDPYYFKVCVRGAERSGLNIESLYRYAGTSTAQLKKLGSRETVECMATLVQDIWKGMDDEFMGFTEKPVKSGAFALMVGYVFHSTSVLEALYKGLEFYRVLTSDIETVAKERNGKLILECQFRKPELDPDHYFIEFWLIIWHRLACWLSGETIPLVSAEFSYPKPTAYLEEFRQLFPCTTSFNKKRCRLQFDLRDLASPIRRSEKELEEMIVNAPLDLMTIPASDHSVARQVYVVLRPWEHGVFNPRTAEEVAEALGDSSTFMRRALKTEGASYNSICENIRTDLACSKLRNTQDSIESIADDLGYVETRSFTRAFRDWTGYSPTEFRRSKVKS